MCVCQCVPACLQFEFSYFFETGTRRRCYLAPERFYDSGQAPPHPDALQPAMVCLSHSQFVFELKPLAVEVLAFKA